MKVAIFLVVTIAVQIAWSQVLYGSGQSSSLSGIMCQLYLGGIPLCPASSCKEVADTRLWSTRSGLHWLTDGNRLVQAYCSNTISPSQSRGWMRAGYVRSGYGCPVDLGQLTAGGRKLCAKKARVGCSSVIFPTHGISYSTVCGLVYGYNKGTPDGFERHGHCPGCTIDDPYLEGVSITHGSPRQHIWSLAAGHGFTHCPCAGAAPSIIPSFVGECFFCDVEDRDTFIYSDKLWDKYDCLAGAEACCEKGQWFCTDLPQATTDDIEFRLCTDQPRNNEDVYIEHVDIFVQ